jgi:hypothetical protein
MKTLHLITRELEPWERVLVEGSLAAGDAAQLDVSTDPVDYNAVLRAVFESDAPMVW